MLYPLTFKPVYQERIWGGQKLSELYGKPISAGVPTGESWEICDRPDVASEVANGPLSISGNGETVSCPAGTFSLLPASLQSAEVSADQATVFLHITPGI